MDLPLRLRNQGVSHQMEQNPIDFSTEAQFSLLKNIRSRPTSLTSSKLRSSYLTPIVVPPPYSVKSSERENTPASLGDSSNCSGSASANSLPTTVSFADASLTHISTPTPRPQPPYPIEVDDLFFEGDTNSPKNYRRAVIEGIPIGTHISQVLHQIDSPIISASLVDTTAICGYMTAKIEFLRGEDAVEFAGKARSTNPVGLLHNCRETVLDVTLVDSETQPLSPHMTRQIDLGATRFLEVLNISEDQVIAALHAAGLHQADAFQAHHTLVDLRFDEPGRKLLIEINSVRSAIRV